MAPLTHVDDCESLAPALDTAAVLLGWRVFHAVWWCPIHVRAKKLLCGECRGLCPECSCAVPRGVAVEGS